MTLKDFYAFLARLFLGYVFFSSGLCKMADGHFGQLIGPPNIIAGLEPYGLADFGLFLAFSQVMIGALIMSQRWSLLGLVMLVPMNASILAATFSMQWKGTPYVNGLLLTINLLALMYEWKTLRFFLLPEAKTLRIPTRTHQLFPNFRLSLGVVVIGFVAAVSARLSPPVLMITGIATFFLAWINVWRSAKISGLSQIALGASLLAVVSLALTEQLTYLKINVYLPLLGGVVLTAIVTAVTSLRIWLSKTRQMV